MNETGEIEIATTVATGLEVPHLLAIEVIIPAIVTTTTTVIVVRKNFVTLLEMIITITAITATAIVRGGTGEGDEGIDTASFNLRFVTIIFYNSLSFFPEFKQPRPHITMLQLSYFTNVPTPSKDSVRRRATLIFAVHGTSIVSRWFEACATHNVTIITKYKHTLHSTWANVPIDIDLLSEIPPMACRFVHPHVARYEAILTHTFKSPQLHKFVFIRRQRTRDLDVPPAHKDSRLLALPFSALCPRNH